MRVPYLILSCFLLVFCLSETSVAANAAPDVAAAAQIRRNGTLPAKGRVVIRSGLAWMTETSPDFAAVSKALAKGLTGRGFAVIPVRTPTVLPASAFPYGHGEGKPLKMPSSGTADSDSRQPAGKEPAEERAANLARSGRLPQVKLRGYAAPEKDAQLSQTVMAVRPPDTGKRAAALRKAEQFSIPTRMPLELAQDADVADYALLVRFAEVFVPDVVSLAPRDALSGVLVAAAGVGGVGSLGFGPPSPPSTQQRPPYGSPDGFRRGYEGTAPNDFWGRDRDFYQRDYQFKYGAPPVYATPPSGSSTASPRGGMQPVPDSERTLRVRLAPPHAPSGATHCLLLLDWYDLAPMGKGREPLLRWSASALAPKGKSVAAHVFPVLAGAVFTE